MVPFGALYSQWFPPAPTFTENDIGDQRGKVFITTGANSGVGFALIEALYASGATVYLACRNEQKAREAIRQIQSARSPATPATLRFLHLDLSDLKSVQHAASLFLTLEERLDVLWNNAGRGMPEGSATAQGLEGNVGVNCVGPFLFTRSLMPALRRAAGTSLDATDGGGGEQRQERGEGWEKPKGGDAQKFKGEARVIYTSSALTELQAPSGGLDLSIFSDPHRPTVDSFTQYASSKTGNWFLAIETARRYASQNIICVSQNPGNLDTPFYEGQSWLLMLFTKPILYEARFGAATGLFCGVSKSISRGENNGAYVWPWGRVALGGVHSRADICEAVREGAAERFWDWCEEQVRGYL